MKKEILFAYYSNLMHEIESISDPVLLPSGTTYLIHLRIKDPYNSPKTKTF